jgi:hypothetical protein
MPGKAIDRFHRQAKLAVREPAKRSLRDSRRFRDRVSTLAALVEGLPDLIDETASPGFHGSHFKPRLLLRQARRAFAAIVIEFIQPSSSAGLYLTHRPIRTCGISKLAVSAQSFRGEIAKTTAA